MPRRPQFILSFSCGKQRGEDIYNMKSPLFVRHNSGHKAKKKKKEGHQRQSFNTFNFVSITKATCYALQLNHNKEAMEGRDLGARKWMLSASE